MLCSDPSSIGAYAAQQTQTEGRPKNLAEHFACWINASVRKFLVAKELYRSLKKFNFNLLEYMV